MGKHNADIIAVRVSFTHSEAALQSACEDWLVHRGYKRLTAAAVATWTAFPASFSAVAGWFGHWRDGRGLPFQPDLLLFDRRMARSLCVELKRADRAPKYGPGQAEAIHAGVWCLARTVDEFAVVVIRWEEEVRPTT